MSSEFVKNLFPDFTTVKSKISWVPKFRHTLFASRTVLNITQKLFSNKLTRVKKATYIRPKLMQMPFINSVQFFFFKISLKFTFRYH